MSTKLKVILAVLYTVVIFGAGWYSVPSKKTFHQETTDTTHAVENKQKDTDKEVQKDKDIKITETINKDGSKTKVTEIIDKSKSSTKIAEDTQKTTDEAKTSVTDKTVTNGAGKFYIGAMAGIPVADLSSLKPNLGLQAHMRVLGPITLGAYGLFGNSQQVGLTAGFTF